MEVGGDGRRHLHRSVDSCICDNRIGGKCCQHSRERNRMGEITTWTADLSVGNHGIDDLHQNLFRLGREALLSLEGYKGNKERSHQVLTEIAEVMWEGFSVEEDTLVRNECPSVSQHDSEHRIFRVRILKIFREWEWKGLDGDVLREVISDWIVNHVAVTDRSCKEYFAEKVPTSV